MKMYAVDVRYYIPANDDDELYRVMNNMGISHSEYYGGYDIADIEYEEDEEEEDVKTRYYVCGIGYDEMDRITDYEQSFGDFDTYEEAYELFVKLQCRNAESFFENAPDIYQVVIELEECEEYDEGSECVDIRNAWRVVNPNF